MNSLLVGEKKTEKKKLPSVFTTAYIYRNMEQSAVPQQSGIPDYSSPEVQSAVLKERELLRRRKDRASTILTGGFQAENIKKTLLRS